MYIEHGTRIWLISSYNSLQVGLNFGALTSPPKPFMQDIHSSDYPSGVIGRNVSSGTRVLVEDSVPSLTPDDLRTILHSVMYQANEEPGFSPRDVCLIAQDPVYDTTACVTLYYIGTNSNPPTITYDAEGVAIFVEGQSAPMRIVEGSITVDDPDHPTRFLIESASASIEGFTEGDAEWLSLNTSYIIPTGVSAAFDTTTGTLIITGNATTDIYSALLEQLTYFNYMTEPEVFTRSVRVTIDDGLHTSSPATITINIMNTNDNPFVSLNGDIPVIMEYSTSYTEGSGAVVIVPNLHVVDSDPSPLIVRATVTLTDPVDGDDEVLGVIDKMGLNLTSSQHSLELTGAESPAVYTAALRTLTYHHLSASPGNPSTQPRTIEFTVEDSHNTTSTTSYLKLVINPVNDAPIISFGSGGSQEIYSYIEDDPAISIGRNITLADIDSPIMSVTLYLTNLLDGLRDSIGYDAALLEAYSLNVTIMDNGTSREIVFEGMASDSNYTEILRSLTYTNLHTNNSVTDGQRFITISATDTGARLSMDTLTLLINVAERNDGPAINLGDGIDAGFTVTYTEGGPSVGIGLSHLIHVMDEEGHSISSMVIKLVSTNNALDEGDLLFIRTPMLLHFFSDPNTNITKRRISISLPGNSSDYIAALQAVRYINTEEEPTLFVNGSKLVREIVIRITDSTTEPAPTTNEVRVTVEIEPINDNAPRIIINSDPVCTEDFRDSGGTEAVSRRSVTPVTRGTHWRRRRSTTHRDNTDNVAAPQVLSIMSSFINSSCLSEMVVVFAMDTNAPVVEVQQELDTLVTFAPASLAKTQHYGYWRDYRTLVIVFRECVKWEREQYSKKPLYVVFYGQEGFCDWDSPCNKGVCYYNSTGCPVVGYHPASTSTHDNHTDPDEPVTPTALQGVDRLLFTVLLAVLLVAVATVLACECRQRKAVWYKQPGNDNCSSEEIKHVVPSHVIDITVPVVTTTATKSPPSPLTETKPATGEIQKVLLLEKDEHLPPPFLQAQGTNLVFLPATNTNIPAKVGEILPRKLPPPE
jgi:hypothetical protein